MKFVPIVNLNYNGWSERRWRLVAPGWGTPEKVKFRFFGVQYFFENSYKNYGGYSKKIELVKLACNLDKM